MEKNNTILEEELDFPKIIHQTYISEETIPEHWQESRKMWKELHCSESVEEKWRGEYKFWSDEDNLNFVKSHFPDFLETFVGFKYNIMRADAIRYMILYTYGGIYADLDIVPKVNIFSHFQRGDVFLVNSANVKSEITNSFMASRPGQKIWLECIEKMKQRSKSFYLGKFITTLFTTGPNMLDSVFRKTDSKVTILPAKFFNATSVREIKAGKEKKESLLRSTKGSSWVSWEGKILNFFNNYQLFFIILGVVALLLFIVASVWIMVRYVKLKVECAYCVKPVT